MTLTLRSILLLIALILFLLGAFGVDLGAISVVALGLAFFAAAFLVPDTVLGGAGGGLGVRDRDRDVDTRR